MQSQKMRGKQLHPEVDDIRDWYFIGLIVLGSALVTWLPVLSGMHF